MRKPLVPLRVKGDRSFGQGVGSPNEYVARARALGLPALALTDAESLGAQVQFHVACRDHGLKPITGAELMAPSEDGSDSRIVLLVENRTGYANLCRLLTDLADAWRERKRSNAQSDHGLREAFVRRLVQNAEGLYFLTGDPVLLVELSRVGIRRSDIGAAVIRPSRSSARESALVAAANTVNVELVAVPYVVMPSEADAELLAVVRAIHTRTVASFSGDPSTVGSLEASDRHFEDMPRAVDAASDIADRCSFDLLSLRPPPPRSAFEDSNRALGELCRGAGLEPPAYATRLSTELTTIAKLGLADYFLMVAELSTEARRRGISLLARGSAVGSLIVHRMGLSPVDPVASGLYFERFVRASRSEPPDIDLDVSSEGRDELVRWAIRRWGRTHASEVASYQSFRRRSAFRDGLRALGMIPSAVERFAQSVPEDDLPIALPVESLPEKYRARVPVLERLIGRPRHLSTHPSGIVVSGTPLSDWVPLTRSPKGSLVTEFDSTSLGRLFALKVDLLGSRAIAALDEVSRSTGTRCLESPTDDPKTLALIDRGNTVGCAQLESPLVRSVLEALPIRTFADVVVAVALVRPGAASGGARDKLLRRARREEPTRAAPSRFESALWETHGVYVFEEDVIRILSSTANVDADEADALRAAIVRGEDISTRFLELASAAGVEEREARTILEDLGRFAAYSFSKAHASSAAWLGYQAAFAKAHHRRAFASGLLNFPGGLYPLRARAAEMSRSGVTLLGPDVNASELLCVVERDAVRIGLGRLKRVTRATKKCLLETRAREGAFRSVAELVERVRPAKVELVALVLSGACDTLLPLNREDYPFVHETVLSAVGASSDLPRKPQSSDRVEIYRALVRAQNELRYLEMHPSAHPMAILRAEATRAGCTSSTDARGHAGRRIRFAGIVTAARRAAAGNGVVQFVTFEDEFGLVEATVAPYAYARLANPIENPGPYLIDGRLELRHGSPVLNVDTVRPFHRRDRPYSGPG